MFAKGRSREGRGNLPAFYPLHDEEWPLEFGAIALQCHCARHRHDPPCTLIGAELGLALGIDQAPARVAPQDQPMNDAVGNRIEAIGFTTRAARNACKRFDRNGRFLDARQISRELCCSERRSSHAGSSRPVKPDGT